MRLPPLLLLLSTVVSTPSLAALQTRQVSWTHEDTRFEGVLVHDEAKKGLPGLLMVPNWMGVNDSAVAKARQLAEKGYVVLVADVYGVDVRPQTAEEASAAAKTLYADRSLLQARAGAALDQLIAQAETGLDRSRLAAAGFCFGGSTVLELARSGRDDLDAVVSFHGGLSTSSPAGAGDIKTSVLVLNGAEDRYVSAEDIATFQQEMSASGADWQFTNLAGAVHCFAEFDANAGPGCQYHPRAAKRAFAAMQDWLQEHFESGANP